jgi:hypothetical protein
MVVQPNLAGYVAAQRRLRDMLGQDVTFLVAGTDTYPPGTVMDPETGRPVDPYVEPTSSGATEVVVRASVVTRPLIGDPNDQARITPVGDIASDQIAFLVDNDDFEPIRNAHEAHVYGVAYRINDKRPDGIGGLQRWIIFGEQT